MTSMILPLAKSFYLAVSIWPMIRARRGLCQTTLLGAHTWGMAAMTAWLALTGAEAAMSDHPTLFSHFRYLASAVTICSLIAVLGARRPGVGAWHFVVAVLLLVLCVPVLGAWLRRGLDRGLVLDDAWTLLFLGLLTVGVFNHLPTRLGWAVCVLGASLALVLISVCPYKPLRSSRWVEQTAELAPIGIATCVWIARITFGCRHFKAPEPRQPWDRVWQDFRDLFGLLWARRLQERFNASAAQLDWPLRLDRNGFVALATGNKSVDPGTLLNDPGPIQTGLRSLLRRFVTDQWIAQRLQA